MLCPAVNRIEITNEGVVFRCNRPQGSQQPLEVPGGFIIFVDSHKFLGSIWTSDTSVKLEIANRRVKFLVKLHFCTSICFNHEVNVMSVNLSGWQEMHSYIEWRRGVIKFILPIF